MKTTTENQDLPVNGGADSDGGACHRGGGTDNKYHSRVPSKGTTPRPPGTILQSITGNGTHVGQFSATARLSRSPLVAQSAHWIAANGDTIDTTVVGSFAETVDMAPCQVVGAAAGRQLR